MMVQRRAIAVFLLLVTVPTPACSQCTTCNQQPSQIYYNSQVAVQPANNGRPAGQFQPPSSVSRNQQIYVWYGNPQPVQNQNNGVQPQYNPNGYNNNNNQQPVMYNNINRDQPNYANQPQPYNPNVPQQTPRPNQSIPGFLPPAGVPSTAFPYSTTTPAYNTVGQLAPINQAFDQPPTYLNTGSTPTPAPYYGSTTAAPPVTTTHVPSTSFSASQFVFTSSSTPSSPSSSSTPAVPSPYLAEGFTPTSSPPPNTNDSMLAPLPVVFPSFPASPVSSSFVNVLPLPPAPAQPPTSNTVIITQSYSGPATAQTGLGQAPSSFSQTIVSPNETSRISLDQAPGQTSISQVVASPNQATQTRIDQNQTQTTLTRTAISANQTLLGPNMIPAGTVTQTVVGGGQVPTSGSQPSSTTTFTFVGTNQGTDAAFSSNQGALGNNQPAGAGDSQFGSGQLPVTSQPGSNVTPLPVIFPSPSNQVATGSSFGQSSGPAFQPNPSASQSSTAFVQDSGPAIPPPVGSQPQFQPNPFAQQQFQPSSTQVPQQPYNPALVTSQTAPVSNQYDATFAPQQQGSAAAAAVGGGSAAVLAAALAAAAAAGSNSTRASTTPFPYSTQFNQGTAMPTIQPVPSASQIPLATSTQGSMQPTSSTLAYSTSPSPSPIPTSSTPAFSPSSPSTTSVPSSTTPFPVSSSPSTTQQPLQQQQQQQVLQPSQQLQQQPLSSTAQPSTTSPAQVYSPSTTAFPYSTQFNQGTPMPTGTASPYYSSTMSPSTTPFYPSTTTMAPPTSTFPSTTTPPMYTSSTVQPQFTNTLQPSQQLQQQPYVQQQQQQQQQQQPSTFAPYSSTQGPTTTTAPVQIGYNPAGQPVYGQPTSTQAPFVSTTPTTPYAQSTTPYGSQYPMTGTPVNQGAIGVNNMNNAPGSTPYYPSTTPSPQQPFYSPSTTQQPFVQGPTTTAPGVYQIGQGVPGVPNTANPQFNPPQNVQSSTYSPYAAGGSTLGTQQMYDPSTGLVTANGMNTMYGRYTTMEPGSQMMRDVPINGGATLSLAAGMVALLFLF